MGLALGGVVLAPVVDPLEDMFPVPSQGDSKILEAGIHQVNVVAAGFLEAEHITSL